MLQFQEETLYLAINLMNRGLRQIKVSTANLQLLGVVCLFLAAKKEECDVPEVQECCAFPQKYFHEETLFNSAVLGSEREGSQ